MKYITTEALENKALPSEIRSINPISRVYLLLGQLFAYPEEGFCEILKEEWARDQIKGLVGELPFEVGVEGIPLPSLSQEDLESYYINTFDIAPACPLYESEYRSGELAQRDIQEELFRFYGHFDVRLSSMGKDYPDHLVAELEFMAFLAKKESAAIENGKDPQPYRLAQRDFLERHLTRWIPLLCERLQEKSKETFYLRIGELLRDFITSHHGFLETTLDVGK